MILVKATGRIKRISRTIRGPFIYHLGRPGNPVRMR